MKTLLCSLVVGGMMAASSAFAGTDLSLAPVGPFSDNSITLVSAAISVIPYGNSVSGPITLPPLSFTPDRIYVSLDGPGCAGSITGVSYSAANGPWMVMALTGDGSFSFNATSVTALQFAVTQTAYIQEQCNYRVTLLASGEVPLPGGSDTLAGAINYAGGFASRLALTLAAPSMVKGVRIAIPSFCSQTEVLEVGTVSDGVYTSAVGSSAGEYQVNSGAGLIASTLEVTLNGPVGVACAVPVYIQ